MCGIAGLAGFALGPGRTAESEIRAMCDAIVHRGPDGDGYFVNDGVALGMRRLSIIDIAGGAQPISSEDGQVLVVFNGEIYNHLRLREELTRAGHTFRTRSDTEVIVHGYEEWGDRVLHRLRGMFAIALWDRNRRRLLLARDRVGIKPLYLWERDGGLAFASELKGLEKLDGFPRQIDEAALLRYLSFGYVPDPLSIWKGVRKLPPGTALTWSAETGCRERPWWSPLVPQLAYIDDQEAVEEAGRLLSEAVECHLIADVPLGAFLSGGVDSSAVVSQMARLTDHRPRTFSIGFDDPDFNEAPDAARVAQRIGTEHTEQILRPDVDALVDDILLEFDEPFSDSSALPTWLVSRLARDRVTVALTGDGGDEAFGGYTRYEEVRRLGMRTPVVRRAARAVAKSLPYAAYGRGFLLNLARSTPGRYASTVGLPALPEEGGVLRPEVAGVDAELEHLLRESFARTSGRDLGSQMALVDVMSYLPGDILTKVDRMSMKVSLEARVPLLDHELLEFALSLPGRLKFRDGEAKWVFRRAIAGLVPPEVLQKPKQGFGVPLARWFRGPLAHRLSAMADPRSPVHRFCDEAAIARLLQEHQRGRRDHSPQLWRLVVLDVWLRAHRI